MAWVRITPQIHRAQVTHKIHHHHAAKRVQIPLLNLRIFLNKKRMNTQRDFTTQSLPAIIPIIATRTNKVHIISIAHQITVLMITRPDIEIMDILVSSQVSLETMTSIIVLFTLTNGILLQDRITSPIGLRSIWLLKETINHSPTMKRLHIMSIVNHIIIQRARVT